jgi:hypothetical protein
MYIVQSTRYEIRGTELKISNAEFRFLNEEVENILLLESPTCLPTAGRVLRTWYKILVLHTKSLTFEFEMKSNAANLIFSSPAQVHHLKHHFHHSS